MFGGGVRTADLESVGSVAKAAPDELILTVTRKDALERVPSSPLDMDKEPIVRNRNHKNASVDGVEIRQRSFCGSVTAPRKIAEGSRVSQVHL
jgi:hypothetical protein